MSPLEILKESEKETFAKVFDFSGNASISDVNNALKYLTIKLLEGEIERLKKSLKYYNGILGDDVTGSETAIEESI